MTTMLPPIRTEHTNLELGKPVNWDAEKDGDCMTLPVHRDPDQGVFYSFWEPTERDIANIIAGMPIRLAVFGIGHPPVAITVTDRVDE